MRFFMTGLLFSWACPVLFSLFYHIQVRVSMYRRKFSLRFVLTIPPASATIRLTVMKRTSTRHVLRKESPWFGGRGRKTDGEYAWELAPERRRFFPVGARRVRPLPRGSVLALHEAVFVRRRRTRGGTANAFALCPHRDGAFFRSLRGI